MKLKDETKELATGAGSVLNDATRVRKSADTLMQSLRKLEVKFTREEEERVAKEKREAQEKRQQYELMIRMLLIKALITISRSYDYTKNEKGAFEISEQALGGIEHAILFINRNLENSLTLDEVAREANMNRSYFCTVFKRLNGMSPWEYITIKRIEKAVDLLKTTDSTMIEIAGMCGFNNTSNFNRAFKKVTGRIPKHYRK